MKKVFRIIGKTLLWIIYFLFTLEKRNLHMQAEAKGMRCTSVSAGLFNDTYTFSINEKPQEKGFLMWKEFRITHNF